MKKTIVLAGNPNVGKSVIFNALTGSYVTVSNYPGTTVDIAEGLATFHGIQYKVIDTPGVNSLIPHSEDEMVTLDIIIKGGIDCIVQVADAKNLQRSLLLTLQLMETGFPMLLDLNMDDEAKERGIDIDTRKLFDILGIDTVKTIATTKEGIPKLKTALAAPRKGLLNIRYPDVIENALVEIAKEVPDAFKNNRAVLLWLISSGDIDDDIVKYLNLDLAKIETIRKQCRDKLHKEIEIVLLEEKIKVIEDIVKKVVNTSKPLGRMIQNYIGNAMMNPFSGFVILVLVLYLMYKFVGQFAAGTVVDYLEHTVFEKHINPYIVEFVSDNIKLTFFKDILVGKYGIITMALTYAFAIIFPIVTAFFIFFGMLEDSGYLPRLSSLSDRIFKVVGLNGRAILPMILGLGCGTMAVLTSRILDTKKERMIITLLLALCVPCSAQLGVIMGLMGGLSFSGFYILVIVLLTIMALVGYISSKLIPGERSSFIQEIPPFRIPKLLNILTKTFYRLKWYLTEAVPLFIAGTLLLFFCDFFKVLDLIKNILSPITVNLLQLPVDTAEIFIMGFLRRDYGTAGLYVLAKNGFLTNQQLLVSLVVITLFIPCIAQFLVTVKERGIKVAFAIITFVSIFALSTGGILNLILTYLLSTGLLKL
ncbi:MAG: ferrous iron transport protein B [Elusimicrobia bacterium]|nr:ferrous iron transport protein B [Candidatus Liberimonas magnetica]